METRTKIILFFITCAALAILTVALYLFLKPEPEEASIGITERTETITVESSSEESKDYAIEEIFKGTVRQGDLHNYRVGNLSYHKYFADQTHEQNLLSIESSHSIHTLAIGISATLVILISLAIIGYKVFKLKSNTTNNNRGNPNNVNGPVIDRRPDPFANGRQRQFSHNNNYRVSTPTFDERTINRPMKSSTAEPIMTGETGNRGGSRPEILHRSKTNNNNNQSETDAFYSVLIDPLFHDIES